MQIGALEIKLLADIARLQRDMDQVNRIVGGTMAGVSKAVDMAKATIAGIAGGLSVGAFAGMIKSSIDAVDNLNDLSKTTNIAIEDLAGLNLAAQQSGTDLEITSKAVNKLMLEIAKSPDKFAKMGISSKEPLEAFRQFVDVFAAMEDTQARNLFAQEAMGEMWQKVAPMLKEGGDAVSAMIARGKELSPVTQQLANDADAFNDKLAEVGLGIEGWQNRMASRLLPTLNAVADNMDVVSRAVDGTVAALGPALKIGAAYFAIFVAAPAILAGAAAALTPLVHAVAVYAMNVAIGQTATIGWNTSLFGTSVAAQLAAGSLTKLQLAANVLFAAFAGWQIGTYLNEQFVEVRVAGLAFVGAMLKGWEHLKYGFLIMGAAIGFAWDNTIGKLGGKFGEFLKMVSNGLQAAGFKQTAATVAFYASQLQQSAAAQQTFAQRTAGIAAAHDAAVAAIDRNIVDLVAYELRTEKGAATSAKAATAQQQHAAAVVATAAAARAAGPAIDEAAQAAEAYQKLVAAGIEDANREVNAIREQTRALQEKIAHFGMLPDAITAVRIAELEAESQSLVLSESGLAAIRAKIDALKDLKAAQSASQMQDETAEAAAEHARAWQRANDQIGQSLTDALMRGGKGAAEYIKDYFRTLVLRPIVQAVMAPVSGAMAMMMPGSASASSGSTGSLLNLAQAGQSIYGAITGGFSALSTAVADSVQAVMYQTGMTTQIASNGAFASAAGTAAGYLGGAAVGIYGGRAISNGYSVIGNSGNTAVNAGTIIGAFFGGPIGAAIGGLIGGLANRAFGHRAKEITGSTLNGHFGMAGNFTGGIDNTWKQEGGWFRSDKSGVDRSPVDQAMVAAFTQGYDALKTATADYAKVLGLNADAIANRVQSMSITLTKDEEKNKQAIADFFAGVGDTMARELLPAVDTLKLAGESASTTLQRLATNYVAVDEVLRAIGMTFGATGTASLEARERLVALSGGVEKLAANTGAFAQQFLTEAERLAPVAAKVASEMAKLGLSAVDTRDEFKAVVLGLDLTTEAGAKQYASLMSLASAFAQVHPAIEATTQAAADSAAVLNERARLQDQLDQLTMTATQLRQKERDALDESNRAIFDRINAIVDERAAIEAARSFASGLMSDVDASFSVLQGVVNRQKEALSEAHAQQMKLMQAEIDAQSKILAKHQALASMLSGTLDNMKLVGGEQSDRANAQAQIRTALAIAKAGGVLPDAESLRKSLGILSQDASSMFATYQDYARDFYTTQNDIAALGKLTDDALTVDEATLKALADQKDLAQQVYEAEIKRLDNILSSAAEQVAVLKGQSTTLLSIEQALAAFLGSIGAALNNPLASATGQITNAYQGALGRAPDAAGMAFWQQKLEQGVSQAEILAAIKNSPEAKAQKLYQEVLGRAGDAGGIKFWTEKLASGVSESAVRLAMMGSAEKRMKLPGFAVGTNYLPSTMPILAHEGERIIPAADNRELMRRLSSGGGDSAALIAEVKELRAEVARFREANSRENYHIAKNTLDTADHLDGAVNGDKPIRTVTEPA